MSQPTPPRKRRRRWPLGLCAAVVGSVLAITGVEFTLRVFDPLGLRYDSDFANYRAQALQYEWEQQPPANVDLDGRLYRHKPHLDLDLGSYRLRTNSLGLRGPEVAANKPTDTFRILLLGDSVAYGWGVDDEVTFARRLETEWNAASPARRIEVINTGHPMYDSSQEEATLREVGLGLHPDLVLLVYVVNDIEPTRDIVEELLSGKNPHPEEDVAVPDDFWSATANRLAPLLPATAKLVGLRSDLEARIQRALPPGVSYRPETWGKGPRGWPRSQAALLRIRDLCASAKVPLLLFDHTLPALGSLPEFCKGNGIAYEELRLSTADHAQGIVNSPLDSHPNAKGHGLLVERLRAALMRRRLLPK